MEELSGEINRIAKQGEIENSALMDLVYKILKDQRLRKARERTWACWSQSCVEMVEVQNL